MIINMNEGIYDKNKLRKYYSKNSIARKYIRKRFLSPLGKYIHYKQVSIINLYIKYYNAKTILDMACGPARLSKDIKGFDKAIGLDTSTEMLDLAKKLKLKDWLFLKRDAFATKFKTCSFDLVYSFRFVRHLKFKERVKIYKEIKRILKKGGLFIFDAVNYDKDYRIRKRVGFNKYPVYDKLYKKEELINELKKAGWNNIELVPYIHNLYTITFISKITSKLRINKIGLDLIKRLGDLRIGQPLEWIVICQK